MENDFERSKANDDLGRKNATYGKTKFVQNVENNVNKEKRWGIVLDDERLQ